jgi:hypothetical protein
LNSSGVRGRKELATRYPGVCWVWGLIVLVFEQIGKYCRHLGPILALSGLF